MSFIKIKYVYGHIVRNNINSISKQRIILRRKISNVSRLSGELNAMNNVIIVCDIA